MVKPINIPFTNHSGESYIIPKYPKWMIFGILNVIVIDLCQDGLWHSVHPLHLTRNSISTQMGQTSGMKCRKDIFGQGGYIFSINSLINYFSNENHKGLNATLKSMESQRKSPVGPESNHWAVFFFMGRTMSKRKQGT